MGVIIASNVHDMNLAVNGTFLWPNGPFSSALCMSCTHRSLPQADTPPWVILQDRFHKQCPVQAPPSQWQSRLRWALTLALAFSPLEPQDSAILLAHMAVSILRTQATGRGRHLRTGLFGLHGSIC